MHFLTSPSTFTTIFARVAFYEHFSVVTYPLTSILWLLFGLFGFIMSVSLDISKDITPEEGKMTTNDRPPYYVYRLSKKEQATNIAIGEIDLNILKAYKKLVKQPMTAVLHEMIGTAVKCWEEKHATYIQELQERNRTLAKIVAAYFEKYGRIRPKGAETPVKGVKEEEAEEKGKPADKDAPPEQ